MNPFSLGLLGVAAFIVFIIVNAIRILPEYERGVVFRLGRLRPNDYGPGLFLLIPVVDRMMRVSLRTVVHDVPPQDIITRDNVSIKVNAVVYFRVMNPRKAVVEVENYHYATSQLSQTTLRSVLGQVELDLSRPYHLLDVIGDHVFHVEAGGAAGRVDDQVLY